jgi:long-chain acyl-CoA synthetase
LPKGVVLTQANVLAASKHINAVVRHSPKDRELVSIPLSHSFGLGRLRCMALTGNSIILEPDIGNIAKILFKLLKSKATGLALVPSGIDLLKRVTRNRLKDGADHIEYIEIGSARISNETLNWLRDMLPHTRLYHHYGMTEASRAIFFDFDRDHKHPNSIGLPSPDVTVTIEDEEGELKQAGEIGEIVISGRMVMSNYLGQKETPSNTVFRSGDLGHQSEDGYFYLIGRKDNVANVGGRKVACGEVEKLLTSHPEIIEAACFGVPDPDGILGEVLIAQLVAAPNIDLKEVHNFLRYGLEAYKIPVHLDCVERLPKTANGKIKYDALRSKKNLT